MKLEMNQRIFFILAFLVGSIYAQCTITEPDFSINNVVVCIKNVNTVFLSTWLDPTSVSGTIYNVTLVSVEGPEIDSVEATNIIIKETPIGYTCTDNTLASTFQIKVDVDDTDLIVAPHSCFSDNFTFTLCKNGVVDIFDGEECDAALDNIKCDEKCLCFNIYNAVNGACCETTTTCNVNYNYKIPSNKITDFSNLKWNFTNNFSGVNESMIINSNTKLFIYSKMDIDNSKINFDAKNEKSNASYIIANATTISANNTVFTSTNKHLNTEVIFSIITENEKRELLNVVIKVSSPSTSPTSPHKDSSKALLVLKIIIFVIILFIASLMILLFCILCTYCCFKKKCKICKHHTCKCHSSSSESDKESECESDSESEKESDEECDCNKPGCLLCEISSKESDESYESDESDERTNISESNNFNKIIESSSENNEYYIEESSE